MTFVSETVGNSNMRHSPWAAWQYLPWAPWAAWQEIETILYVTHRPGWPRQEQWWVSLVTVACVIVINFGSLIESCHPRWQRQVRQLFSCRKTANSITNKLRQWKYGLMLRQNKLQCLSLASIFRLPLWRLERLTKGRLPAKQRTNGLAYLSWKISFRALTT